MWHCVSTALLYTTSKLHLYTMIPKSLLRASKEHLIRLGHLVHVQDLCDHFQIRIYIRPICHRLPRLRVDLLEVVPKGIAQLQEMPHHIGDPDRGREHMLPDVLLDGDCLQPMHDWLGVLWSLIEDVLSDLLGHEPNLHVGDIVCNKGGDEPDFLTRTIVE